MRHFICLSLLALSVLAHAGDEVALIGVIGNRAAVLSVGGGDPKTVKLDSVRVGGIEMHNVDAMVLDGGLDLALLGMSFLNRVQMQRDGATMILIQRF